MKSVLISIHPQWCELIADGKKTVEVRKTRPKIETLCQQLGLNYYIKDSLRAEMEKE